MYLVVDSLRRKILRKVFYLLLILIELRYYKIFVRNLREKLLFVLEIKLF